MGTLLSQVIPLALGAAISPVLFLLTLTTLTGARPLVRGIAVTAGAAVPLVVIGAFAFAIAGSLHASHATKATIDLAFGVLLVLVGIRALVEAPAAPKPAEEPKRPSGPARSFALGFGAMVTNVTTLALYLPAMKLIATSHVSDADRALAHVIVGVITLAPAVVPVALVAVAPRSSRRILGAVSRFMSEHRRALPVVLGFGFGAWLIVKGVAAL
jgi:threonine/homoserine/homoserine lactone efflux protein